MPIEAHPPSGTKHAIPRGVWVLGIVSLLMDISSEMIHSLLPLYLTVGLGASVLAVGFIEGAAEATALVVKMLSGTLSDAWGKRKWLAAAGYGLGALSKPLFPLAGSAGLVFAARFIDRIGKGIRGAPRDALIADLTHDSFAAPPSGCANRSTRSAPLPGRSSRLRSCWHGPTIFARCSGSR